MISGLKASKPFNIVCPDIHENIRCTFYCHFNKIVITFPTPFFSAVILPKFKMVSATRLEHLSNGHQHFLLVSLLALRMVGNLPWSSWQWALCWLWQHLCSHMLVSLFKIIGSFNNYYIYLCTLRLQLAKFLCLQMTLAVLLNSS